MIAFARAGESILLDVIPLSEVTSIELMMSADQRNDQQESHTNTYDAVIDFTHAFQIRTVKNGQNAGRKYILRASSDEEAAKIVEHLCELKKKAAERAAANSWRERMQLRIRILYRSQLFQAITSTLIVAVRALPQSPHFFDFS